MASSLNAADIAAISAAVAAALPAPPPAPPPRDFAAEQNLKDQRSVLQKLLHPYDGTRKVKTLRRWLEVQETYLRTFVPLLVPNAMPPPAMRAGVWPNDLPRIQLMNHLKTQVEKGAQTLHDLLEREVNVTGAFTVNTFPQYQARFVANFLPSTVRNEVESNLRSLRFTGSINQLVEDIREQIEEVTAANELSLGIQATFSNLELIQMFQDMFRRSSHPEASNLFNQIANIRVTNPNSNFDYYLERIVAFWAALGHTDDSTSKPRTGVRREEAYPIRGRGRGAIRSRGSAMYQPYAVTCHYCGGFGHRANQCASNPNSRMFSTMVPRGQPSLRGSYRGSRGGARGIGSGRGAITSTSEEPQQTPSQTAGRGQASARRAFPFGPRYTQPYRTNPYYGNQFYNVSYQECYPEFGYEFDTSDPYVINEQYMEHEGQYADEDMPDAAETTRESADATPANSYSDFQNF